LDVVLRTKQCSDDQVVDAGPKQIHVDAHLLKMFAERTERPLISEIILFAILVSDELVVLFVDCVIC